ncbi:hypothetical protein B0H66DRAFT_332015 [Apodospora peruviana]|uniref:HIT-type domain-containing protein n=1 Tax=Apodospora peruviana TaxID=516989 RepID=A0AAE0M174_9PEZI|nr:hypothetical protein B0H66DRAFT_332015 [Apodospora peruviana]
MSLSPPGSPFPLSPTETLVEVPRGQGTQDRPRNLTGLADSEETSAQNVVPDAPASAQPSRRRAQEASVEETEPSKRQARVCDICEENQGKYKCPKCPLTYCSVACNKLHKANHPPDQPQAPKPQVNRAATAADDNAAGSTDQDDDDPWAILEDSRYEDELDAIHEMYEGTHEMLDRVRRMYRGVSGSGLPNNGVGMTRLERGKFALDWARQTPGYAHVLRLLSELVQRIMLENGQECPNVTAPVREEAATEEAMIIKGLRERDLAGDNQH